MYETILFDLDDTLVDFQSSLKASLQRLHADFYSNIDFAYFEHTFKTINSALWLRVGSLDHPITPSEIKIIRFLKLHQQLKCNGDPIRIANIFENLLGETTQWLPNVKPAIEFLSKKNHLMGIITNGLYHAQRKKYELCELHKWFHAFTVSDKVGVTKPHKAIFDITLSSIAATLNRTHESFNRNSILMVGDSLHHDGLGAQNAGIHFCFVNSQSLLLAQHELPMQHHIASVAELPIILGYKEEYRDFISA